MVLSNLKISLLAAHEIFQRADDRTMVPPRHGQEIIALSQEALNELADRIISALGKASRSMEMNIFHSSPDSAIAIARELINTDSDDDFVAVSARAADRLAEAQSSRNIPGGVLVVIRGVVGHPARDMIALIKAEVQSGFVKKLTENGSLAVEFLTELFLTPESKLYKIGIFVAPPADEDSPLPAGWNASVYDVAMTAGNRMTAAQYFYEKFLGLTFPQNAAMRTKQFHDLTRSYISNLQISEEKKSDLHNALITYLKVEVNTAIHAGEFAELYFADSGTQDEFMQFMAANQFPLQQVQKDISDIQSSLRFRRVVFPRDIKLTAPAESFGELITLETIEGDTDPNGQIPTWTKIVVKGSIQTQS